MIIHIFHWTTIEIRIAQDLSTAMSFMLLNITIQWHWLLVLLICRFQDDPRKPRARAASTRAEDSPSPMFRSNSTDDLLNQLGPLPVSSSFCSLMKKIRIEEKKWKLDYINPQRQFINGQAWWQGSIVLSHFYASACTATAITFLLLVHLLLRCPWVRD